MVKRITIKDVAREAGLTATAVSRALSDKSDISAATKEKVRRIAKELGYVNNLTARALRQGKTKQIAVVYDNLINPYFSIMTSYLQTSLKRHEYTFLTFVEEKGVIDVDVFNSIMKSNVDGIISFLEPTLEINDMVINSGIPLILLGRKTEYSKIDFIDTDDIKGGRLAAEHLISKGCKKILYISEGLHITCARDRYIGYRNALEKAGIYNDNLHIFLDGGNIRDKFNDFLKTNEEFDGIFCFNDLLAFEVESLLEKNKIANIKIVGFDNIQDTINLPRQLTTIGSDKKQMAEVTVEVLLYKIDNKATDRKFSKIHDVFLVEGVTT